MSVIVSEIDFAQRDLIVVTFDQPVLAKHASFSLLSNYSFTAIDGGVELRPAQVLSNIKSLTPATTTKAYLFMLGGSLGATYEVQFQNIKSAQTGLVMDPNENRFTIKVRTTRLDYMKQGFPSWYDKRVGSQLWGVLYAASKEFTRLGG